MLNERTGTPQKAYIASITREQFMFHEMRVTAALMCQGVDDEQILEAIVAENLFQYPTEKMIRGQARACIKRLRSLSDESLVADIATQPVMVAKQLCLYAFMKQSHLVWDFMVTVIGEKYRSCNLNFSRMDLNVFFMQLQEQDDAVATWSDTTITKLKQIIARILVETEYLDDIRSDHLNPVWLNPILENAIKSNNDDIILPAFNYFS